MLVIYWANYKQKQLIIIYNNKNGLGTARTVTDRMCAVAQYYDISSKADRGDIFIVHNQKSSYRTPLMWGIL